jgi:type IV secretory pathway VirB2 component (pilin)
MALLVLPTYAAIAGGRKQAHNGAQSEQTHEYVTKILSMNWGRWLVGIIGVLVIAVGLYQIYEGIRLHFDSHIQPRSMSSQKAGWIKRAGQFGTVARGVVFTMIGLFLFVAAIQNNPGEAKGFDEALLSLLQQPYGLWLMGAVAVGLIAFGIYSIFCGLWFRVKK